MMFATARSLHLGNAPDEIHRVLITKIELKNMQNKQSNNKTSYIHIKGMNTSSL